ncbi:MAG: hypothetical protein IH936_05645 [Acidobacteria bacterium]|nr:hypothetical protein [Acidobacteriota bacterium]
MSRRGDNRVMVTMHRSLCYVREGDVVLLIPAGVPIGVMIESHVKPQCQGVDPRGDP